MLQGYEIVTGMHSIIQLPENILLSWVPLPTMEPRYPVPGIQILVHKRKILRLSGEKMRRELSPFSFFSALNIIFRVPLSECLEQAVKPSAKSSRS